MLRLTFSLTASSLEISSFLLISMHLISPFAYNFQIYFSSPQLPFSFLQGFSVISLILVHCSYLNLNVLKVKLMCWFFFSFLYNVILPSQLGLAKTQFIVNFPFSVSLFPTILCLGSYHVLCFFPCLLPPPSFRFLLSKKAT